MPAEPKKQRDMGCEYYVNIVPKIFVKLHYIQPLLPIIPIIFNSFPQKNITVKILIVRYLVGNRNDMVFDTVLNLVYWHWNETTYV